VCVCVCGGGGGGMTTSENFFVGVNKNTIAQVFFFIEGKGKNSFFF